ncbi:hypothetical protein WG78_10995 [Amantichitinum ursilacus]|uniref:Replication protein P n=1 Tax=Amantichitinum ursilacus TaxID=857265 RepID=A0A0N0GNN9_9NEIS|nr:hypothetical protein WG78_10995 [Amantichitinum ursilacus]
MAETTLTVAPNAWTKRTGTEKIIPIKTLWGRLDGIFPGLWRTRFPDELAIENWCREWAEGLYEEAVTFAMVKTGLEALRRRQGPDQYPPSLPEFIALCKAIPDFEEAFYEAQKQSSNREYGEDSWSHPAVYWAALDFGVYELRQTTWKASKTRWVRILSNRLSGPCSPIPKLLPKPVYKRGDPATAQAAMEQIKSMPWFRVAGAVGGA